MRPKEKGEKEKRALEETPSEGCLKELTRQDTREEAPVLILSFYAIDHTCLFIQTTLND